MHINPDELVERSKLVVEGSPLLDAQGKDVYHDLELKVEAASLDKEGSTQQTSPRDKNVISTLEEHPVLPKTKSDNNTTSMSSNEQVNLSEYMCLGGAYLLFRLPWLFMLPMVECPDEFAHYWVIKFLRENLRLPNAQEVLAGGPSAVYGSLPQLGYIPHVLFSFAFPLENLALAERLGSLFMGALMMLSAYKIGKLLFPQNRLAALALPAAIVVHPQLAFIHAYANCDSSSSALASVMLWLGFESVCHGLRLGRTLIIGGLTGWLAITKYSGLAIMPVIALALVSALFLQGGSVLAGIGSFVLAAIIAIALCSWWFLRNNVEYAGDFSGTQTMYKSWATTFHKDLNYYLPVSHIIKDHRWWRMTFFSYCALFGYMNKYLPKFVYWLYGSFAISALLGAVLRIARLLRQRIQLTKPSSSIVMWTCLGLCVFINITLMVLASTKNLGGPQGRYLITSEIPIMALLIGGMTQLGDKKLTVFTKTVKLSDLVIQLFLLFNVIVCIGSWIYLFRLYGGWHLDPLSN